MRVLSLAIAMALIITGPTRAVVIDQMSPTTDIAELEGVTFDNGTWIISKTFHQFTTDDAPSILVVRIQTDGEAVIPIQEIVTNDTDMAWTDYHVAIINVTGSDADADAAFDLAALSISVDRFASLTLDATTMSFADGVVPAGETLNLGFTIATNGTVDGLFLLKQYPTPEPATLLLLAGGAISVLRRRR